MAVISKMNKLSPTNAMWGEMVLLPPGKAYGTASAGIWDGVFNYTAELDAEQQETTEAQNPLDVKGGDKQKSFSISVEVNKYATGQNPLTVYSRWIKALGKSARFFIGPVPIDGSRYILKRVEINFTNDDIAASGTPFRVFLSLEFIEDTILRVSSKGVEDEGDTTKKTASTVGPKKAERRAEASVFGGTNTPRTNTTSQSQSPSVFA